jgi:hypothetical protein
MNSPECMELDDQLEALALGQVPEPARARLHAHVAVCTSCRGRFDEMLGLTDMLLALAPRHEPPPGFESRVLDRLSMPEPSRSRRPAVLLSIAAAVLILVAAFAAVAMDRRSRDEGISVARSGIIVGAGGARVGDIQLVRGAQPYVLIAIDHPKPGSGPVSCQLQLPDGRSVIVGSWSYDDVRGGIWAAGLDDSSLAAVAMQIVDSDGTLLATASLHE